MKPVTMRDIATQAGCSTQAVSLALRGSPKVSAELTQDVQRIAKQMGYSVDPRLSELARYLRSRRG